MLTRDTNWRQADLLTQETAATLTALNNVLTEKYRFIVMMHDCDLPHDSETLYLQNIQSQNMYYTGTIKP